MAFTILEDALTRPAVLAPAILLIGYVLYQLFRPSGLPDVPIVGARPGEWFPLIRAKWRNTKDMKTATEVAYDLYRDQTVIFPIAGAQNFVQLPASQLQWLVDQPDTELNLHEQVLDSLQLDLTVMDPRLIHNPIHQKLISTILTRETGNLVPTLLDETQFSVDHFWGNDTENWSELCVYDVMRHIIGQVTNRVFVGLPLCRNQDLLDAGIAYAQDIPMSSTALRFTWKPLRPLAALFMTLPNRIHTRKFYSILRPEVERRLRDYDARRSDPETKAADKEPNDFLQWSLNQAKMSGDPYMAKVDTLSGRILLLNFASTHTSSFAMTHALLDLASSKAEYFDELRTEIRTVLAEHGGEWNKRALAAMSKLDSVLRESQRLNSFVSLATVRVVVRKGGIDTPDGVHIPYGTVVCAPSYPVFHDPAVYPEPLEFKPFRFAEKRAVDHGAEKGEKESTYVQRARLAFATTSPEYCAFGHGRHACPGRFFAASELKLMLAYIILNYDIQIQEKRPENFWFGMNRIPPMKATIKVRRRKGSV
ncbi:cytochrome P450 [Annulohypoxylon moriforme]|nr:cytochrome P450 [Annulohypoxylon moriforme]